MTLIRPIAEADRPLIESWIRAEPDHANNTFEFYGQPGAKTVIYEDEEGPVVAVRYSSALRIDMEFANIANRERIRAVMTGEIPGVFQQAKQQGFSEIVFTSVSQKLIGFLREFGFDSCPDYRKAI